MVNGMGWRNKETREARKRTTIYKYSCSFVKMKPWGRGNVVKCRVVN